MPKIGSKPKKSYAIRLRETPIEQYLIRDISIQVKREDLSWPFPALSKARGVWAAIENRPEYSLAVVDTARSLNGQLVSTIGMTMGRKVICGFPRYKADPPDYIPGPYHAIKSLGIPMIPIKANRQFVMRSQMGKYIAENYPNEKWFIFPTGLRLPETIEATKDQGIRVIKGGLIPRTVIVPSGTGTHLAGLMKAFRETGTEFIATLGYKRNLTRFRRDVQRASEGAVLDSRLRIVETNADYYEVISGRLPPFPAHLHYECRAWNWLTMRGVVESLPQPILFWNVGA